MNTTLVALPHLQTKCYDSCLFHWSVNPISEYLLDRFIIGEDINSSGVASNQKIDFAP